MARVLIINNHTRHLKKLQSLLPCSFQVIDWQKISLKETENYDVIILTGGTNVPTVSGYEGTFAKEMNIICSSGKPIIGICLGCELLARTFGATLKYLGEKRKGIIDIQITKEMEALLKIKQPLSVYEAHSWAIETWPTDIFSVLAYSQDGPEIIKHKTLPLWGLQFHPDNLTNKTFGDEIFLKILKQYL